MNVRVGQELTQEFHGLQNHEGCGVSMSYSSRLSLLVSLILLGLVFASFIGLPVRTFQFVVLGSPLSISLSTSTLVSALLVALTWVGTDSIMRSHPKLARARSGRRVAGESGYMFTFWTLPSLVTVAAAAVVPPLFTDKALWLVGLGLTYVSLALVLMAEYHVVDPADPLHGRSRVALNLFTYAAAFVLYAAIYATRTRSLLSSTAVLVVTIPLALELLRGTEEAMPRAWTYVLVIGLIMGQVTWALNYWGMSGLLGGVWLLLIFYVSTGLVQQHLLGRLSRRVALEYGVVALVALVLVLFSTRWPQP